MHDQFQLDDAATAALWALRSEPREHIGALYRSGDGYGRTPTVSGQSNRASGALRVPSGSLAALFHNHPRRPSRGLSASDTAASEFSDRDREQARALGVPSYISAGDHVMRFDPGADKTEEVLAQIPIEEIRRLYLSEALKK